MEANFWNSYHNFYNIFSASVNLTLSVRTAIKVKLHSSRNVCTRHIPYTQFYDISVPVHKVEWNKKIGEFGQVIKYFKAIFVYPVKLRHVRHRPCLWKFPVFVEILSYMYIYDKIMSWEVNISVYASKIFEIDSSAHNTWRDVFDVPWQFSFCGVSWRIRTDGQSMVSLTEWLLIKNR